MIRGCSTPRACAITTRADVMSLCDAKRSLESVVMICA